MATKNGFPSGTTFLYAATVASNVAGIRVIPAPVGTPPQLVWVGSDRVAAIRAQRAVTRAMRTRVALIVR